MRKFSRIVISTVTLVSLLLCAAVPTLAKGRTLHIASGEDFLRFAQDCRLDSYSRELQVSLDADLDLTGLDFEGIPTFSGQFSGNSHTISGISLEHDGSAQGLFRYLTADARVQDLTVCGTVALHGSSQAIGGIAGRSEGVILNCRFDGAVSGSDRVGGIAGENLGTIAACQTAGTVRGTHFTGGIAGANKGLIRDCTNESQVNATVEDNRIDLKNITVNTITGTEAINTVTDIGGIAGTSTGLIRDCTNRAVVGYPHIGYNIGGIAGSQMGYLGACSNEGPVYGRKEIGGIVGQMEPVSRIEYEEDTLQILREQLGQTAALAGQASRNASDGADAVSGQMSALQSYSQSARDAIDQMIPGIHKPLPDRDSFLAAQNTLISSLTGMKESANQLGSAAQSVITGTTRDIQAVMEQMAVMQKTLNEAPENLGGTVRDSSDADTAEDLSAKVEGCRNHAPVQGDLNVGGIVGAIAQENDMDPEDDLELIGDLSLHFSGELRAVLLDCRNDSTITAKKRNVGGIAGRVALGLLKNCVNTGDLDATAADFVGGIAGTSLGYLRQNSVKCRLSGRTCVGGIAGGASLVTDCRSLTSIRDAREKSGSILGIPALDDPLKDASVLKNVYLPAGTDQGGIDGISYDGLAAPMKAETFFKLPGLDDAFAQVCITFAAGEDRTVLTVPVGQLLDPAQIPAPEAREGHLVCWEGLEQAMTEPMCFDRTFHLSVTPYETTVQSQQTRPSGKPVLLAQGLFADDAPISIEAVGAEPALSARQTLEESWAVPAFEDSVRLHLARPEPDAGQALTVLVQNADGSWRDAEASENGSYLLFDLQPGETRLCLISQPRPFPWLLCLAGVGGGIILVGGILALILRRRKKNPSVQA